MKQPKNSGQPDSAEVLLGHTPRKAITTVWFISLTRVGLGTVFLAAGISKLQNLPYFIHTVMSYGILHGNLARLYGSGLPWVETLISYSVIFGALCRFTLFAGLALIETFVVANVYALFHPAVPDICECFGPIVSLDHRFSIGADVLMLLMSVHLLRHQDEIRSTGVCVLLRPISRHLGRSPRLILEGVWQCGLLAVATIMISYFVSK